METLPDWKNGPKFQGSIHIGNSTIIRENVIINLPSTDSTIIGSNCYIMNTCYIGHDSKLGDNVTIETNIHYPISLPNLPCFSTTSCPIAEIFTSKCVSLPLFPGMTSDEIKYIINSLNKEFVYYYNNDCSAYS
jgi:NDP-sugar pyrophosphorylase family protein